MKTSLTLARFFNYTVVVIIVVLFSNTSIAQSTATTASAFSTQDPVRPVIIESFTTAINASSKKAELKWITAGENNLSHFVIEKSADGVNFNDAGVFFSYGNATDKTNYFFNDNISGMQAGTVYYRLRSVDNNGKSNYSDSRMIRVNN